MAPPTKPPTVPPAMAPVLTDDELEVHAESAVADAVVELDEEVLSLLTLNTVSGTSTQRS